MLRRLVVLLLLLAPLAFSPWALAKDKYQQPGPVRLDHDGEKWADKTLRKLTLEEKIGQMLSVRYFMDFENFDSDAYRQFREQMQKYHIGSVVLTVHVEGALLLKNPPLEAAAMANRLQRDSKLPLLIAADFERGLATRMNSVPIFPDAMAFGATGNPAYAERFGAIAAEESRAVGIHWDFWPIADVNSNPANPIINTRSYGEDPAAVGEFAAAFIRGARAHGMLTTAKHFPGHGDTGTDSHLGVARVEGDMARLQQVELPPFRKAIAAGADAVMVAHVAVPALEPDANKVATISANVIGGTLRRDLGFQGLVVTDALEMKGLINLYPAIPGPGNAGSAGRGWNPAGHAAVDAVKAGNDMLLLPSDLDGAYRGLLAAVRSGELTQTRIDQSVRRILEMKASVGLNHARLVDLEQVPYRVSKQQDMEFAQQVADDALTVVRDNGQVFPIAKLPPPPEVKEFEFGRAPVQQGVNVVAIVMSDNAHGGPGRGFVSALKARRADATVFYVDSTLATPLAAPIVQAVKDAGKVVVAVYLSPVAGKQVMINGKLENTVGLEPASEGLLRQILDAAAPKTAVFAMGNPYVAQQFPDVKNYVCTFSGNYTSEISAVKFLFGELKPRGRLPVTLPGIAPRGTGK
jgi:beta-N-acetylhexosaminidase